MTITTNIVPLFLALAVVLLPLCSFAALFFIGQRISERARGIVASLIMFLSFAASFTTLISVGTVSQWSYDLEWFSYASVTGIKTHAITFLLNGMSLIMLNVVTFISFLVHLYSIEYMGHKKNHSMYYPYLGLFTTSMAVLVLSHNIMLTFIGWELVGFSSYLLIGFWFDKEAASRAAGKAFLINRVADVFFLLALLLLFFYAGSFDLNAIAKIYQAGTIPTEVAFSIGLLLFIGCMAKTAQFPLNSWLPDAMEGPTPVSALLHAATMVAAGVYLLVKFDFMLPPDVRFIMAIVGAITALLGALPALSSFDSKKILAFSTISQLGYMVAAIGCSASAAAFFHLITHAFFKAGLFLSVGVVIHVLHKVQLGLVAQHRFVDLDPVDIRFMGGLYKRLPMAFGTYLITAASLVGLPFFSGFLSKESMLNAMYAWAGQYHGITWFVPLSCTITVFLTAYYITRQGIWIFGGSTRLKELKNYTEEVWTSIKINTPVFTVPLILLSAGSCFLLFSAHPFALQKVALLGLSGLPEYKLQENHVLALFSILLVLAGAGLAFGRVRKQVSLNANVVENGLFARFYYIDDIMAGFIVSPLRKTSRMAVAFDRYGLDRSIHLLVYTTVLKAQVIAWCDRVLVDGVISLMVYLTGKFGKAFRHIQKGNVQNYLFWVLVLMMVVLIGVWFKSYKW